jgi:hypothetical protein
VLCPSRDDSDRPCAREFRLEFLQIRRAQGRLTAGCQQCYVDHDVERLLTGFPRPMPLSVDLERTLEEIRASVLRTGEQVALTVMVKALQIVLPAAAGVSTLVLTGAQLDRIQVDLDPQLPPAHRGHVHDDR